ncbi:uncharacterized protein LOC111711491 [Eurytemora carolleeae]|uniref:uncharacterized protein LOC111711491 n=1 Tax=Eurytemora carolleeae TaxID=1294199 RepID=UPI000C770CFC|nr:uncharacterized protein LOC111711491 [Eurytemora carolleeae]|eukprot:XP_023341632.1 uncharacterized protein LOC111711491 [Eurytemora affinis]
MSDCGSLQYDTLRRIESPLTGYIIKPSSPSLSDRSLPPFSSGSSVSGTSTGSGGSNSTSQEEQLDSASTLAASMTGNEDVLSLSSGVGTSSNSGSGGSAATPTGRWVSIVLSGSFLVLLESSLVLSGLFRVL